MSRAFPSDILQTMKKKTTAFLIRHIAQDLNRTMSAKEISYVHQVSKIWVLELANRMRNEGFKIPQFPPKGLRFGKTLESIRRFKHKHPELLKDFKAIIQIDNVSYYLDPIETKRLVQYLPKIALSYKPFVPKFINAPEYNRKPRTRL